MCKVNTTTVIITIFSSHSFTPRYGDGDGDKNDSECCCTPFNTTLITFFILFISFTLSSNTLNDTHTQTLVMVLGLIV